MITIDFSQSKTSKPIADVVFLLNAATSFLYTLEIKDARFGKRVNIFWVANDIYFGIFG